PAGTVTVRVIAGTPAAAVVDAEVTLTVNGEARTAKSDASGRATFSGLPVGATVQATILDEEKKPQISEAFPVPPSGGVRLMLSTKPFTGAPASHGASGAAGGQGAPEARAMSGTPRPDQAMRPGAYQVRLTYNSFTVASGAGSDPEPPVGETVTLVGYHSDNTVDVRTLPVDAKGLATFEGLDISGHTTYFTLARLPRAGGVDRLFAVPVQPDTQVGAKVILSGDKRTATTPPIDDVMTPQSIATPAGKVRVTIEGVPVDGTISIVDAATKTVLGQAQAVKGPPDPSRVQGGAPFQPATDLPPGALGVRIHGGPGTIDAPLPDVPLRVIPADQDTAEGVSSKTGPDGAVQLQVPATGKLRAVFNINGKALVSEPFEVAKSGGRLDVTVRWEAEGPPQAMFDVAYKPGIVLYAETRAAMPGARDATPRVFRSRPIQLVEGAGAHLPITVYPRVLLNFSKRAFVEDELLAVRGSYTLENVSWAPYSAGPDGMVIPLPKGFKGAKVAEESQSIASIAPGEGVRILRPLPPGRTQFVVGYSLKSDGGEIEWRLDIPYDMFQSGMEIRLHDGMEVKPEGRTRGRLAPGRDGSQWYVLDDISIRAGQAMVMKITGMPAEPAWRFWLPRLIGIVVAMLMIGGVVLALIRKPAPVAPRADRRRSALLDELVELERTGEDPERREQVLAELERLWRE
ncbi:MAG TPA: carboxypeptidase-like regulatory domain-containing protein, partial [Kofleriaceae bacterium]|nr:carboxypeptidase-like regulatory domain-containing protein [Kofleriaceae bacterium]